MKRTGKLLCDDDGHDYIIPLDKVANFTERLNAMNLDDADACEYFDIDFSPYRLGCSLSCFIVTLEEDDGAGP